MHPLISKYALKKHHLACPSYIIAGPRTMAGHWDMSLAPVPANKTLFTSGQSLLLLSLKIEMLAPLVAGPPHANSTTDTVTHFISDINDSMVNLIFLGT